MQDERGETGAAGSTATANVAGERRSVLQNALGAIERLQARIDANEAARHEPIAIVGLGCRVPGGVVDAKTYWDLLVEGRDVVGEIPPERWDVDAYYDPNPGVLGKANTKAGGFLDDMDGFEPGFFGMSPREAAGLDPQQRLLLEVAWEALENAAIPADQLDTSLTGVFVGITSMDYASRIDVSDPARSDIYLATGTALNAAAGRVSFTLGLQGPCMAIDTACSSSLVAIHTACQSLRDRESNLALAGGVNVILSPDPFVLISKWGMLSPDGRCKTFDASANGFVRGEGCGLIVLERLSDALANGRNVLAVIRGSSINQDGRSSGLTVPNGLAQQAVVRQALASAGLKPTDVSYVEAHGTGTSLGDPIEVEALAAVYGEGRDPAEPFEIGSVKSNIGHLEAASGVTGLIKLVLAMQHKQLPASLHVKQPTPAIPWDRLPVRISTTLHDWAPSSGRRLAGVSAFGFSGMNAHVILEEAPAAVFASQAAARPLQLLPLSAKSEPALAALATRYADHLQQHPELALADVCATAANGRSQFGHRLALQATDSAGMVAQLRAAAEGEGQAVRGQAAVGARTRVAFLFTGQGSQYVGMGRELDQTEPVFRATLDRCAAVLDPLLAKPLRELLFEETGGLLDQTGNTQPALYALEVSLAALWRSWGIEPSVLIGHSVGEFAAAAVAGVFSIEDGARLIAARGRLMQALPAGGAMVSVQGDSSLVEQEVARHSGMVSIAARNAPGNLVIAGARAPVEQAAAALAGLGLRTQALTVSHAFHSPLMEPMLDEFRRVAAAVPHAAPTLTWVSNLSGAAIDWSVWGTRMAEYWCRHVREPVAFESGMRALAGTQCDACVEIGPSPTLIGLGQQCLGETAGLDWLPSLKRTRAAREQLLDSVARLYVRGARLDWRAISDRDARRCLVLPSYPFQRQRYLIDLPKGPRRAQGKVVHDLLGARISVAGVAAQFERVVGSADPAWVADHRIGAEVVMPLTAYLEAALAAARQAHGDGLSTLDAVEVGEALVLRDGEDRLLQVVVDGEAGATSPRVRVFSRDAARDDAPWLLHASASAQLASVAAPAVESGTMAAVAQRCTRVVEVGPFYDKLRGLGVDFGTGFRGMRRVGSAVGEALGEIDLTSTVAADAGKYLLHPALLDACFHVSAVAMDTLPGSDDGRMYLPIGVDRYHWFTQPVGALRSHALIRAPQTRGDMLVIDVNIETAEGQPVARLEGLRCRRASRDMFRQRIDAQVAEWLYTLAWKEQSAGAERTLEGQWLVFDEGEGRGVRLAAEIVQRGGQAQRVLPGTAFAVKASNCIEIDPALPAHYNQALAHAAGAHGLAGVVSLWPLRVPALGDDALPSTGQRFGTDAALLLVQALAAAPAPLWLVTSGSELVDGCETPRLEQAPVAGLARVAALEHPDLRVTLVDLDPQASAADSRQLADELASAGEPANPLGAEHRVALRKGARHVARLVRKARSAARPVDEAPTRLHISSRGTLENLAIGPTTRRAPGPGEIELRVRASGLNFRDVLSALGLYPGEIKNLGSDCAGEIVALGSEVKGFKLGDRVVAMVEGAFASHATTRWEFVAPLPAGLDFELGAAIPTAYLTADITLNQIARMKKGDRVLIHSGAGGVGMAAIALARRVGAKIFATAGSPDKRAVLERMGVHHVLDSRTALFADEIHRITGGKGVNIVLNSLTGAMLDRSFEALGNDGIFLEIGKRNLWTHAQVEQLGRGIRYHIVDCNDNARDTPQIVGEIFARVLREIESGVLPLLPCTTFPFERAPDAFRFMAQARHIGRVVFRHPVVAPKREQPVRADATYLVTGGLKGLGLLVAQWLADEGARHLVLAGRGAPDASAQAVIAALAGAGVQVLTVAADIGSAEGVRSVMAKLADPLPALGGVVHCAAVLDDGVLSKQTPERFAKVMAPKADGAWRLHRALHKGGLRPDFFVMFSSMSAVLGSPGQGNYVAANAFLDALARHRHVHDLPATSINWGAWKDVGMAARGSTVARAGAQGLESLSPQEGMQALSLILREAIDPVSVAPIDWQVLTRQLGSAAPPALLLDLVAQARSRAGASTSSAAARVRSIDFAALAPEERQAQIINMLRRELATVLALGDAGAGSIVDDDPFTSLGLDSLTAVELRNRLQLVLGRPVAATAAFEWPTVAGLAVHLNSLFGDAAGAASTDDETREEVTL
ncbi:MAG: SDR family NAD(P)-dependent oxidoreductase [Burkholderiales bacterium]